MTVLMRFPKAARPLIGFATILVIFTGGCVTSPSRPAGRAGEKCVAPAAFGFAKPETQGVSAHRLLALTNWVVENPKPIFSFLISKNGRVIYEMTTSGFGRSEAHDVASITASVSAALLDVAMAHGTIGASSPDLEAAMRTPVAELIPTAEFADEGTRARWREVTLRDILGMSAVDAGPASSDAPSAKRRSAEFRGAPDRLAFALRQKNLSRPGVDFQDNEMTPALLGGALQFAEKNTLFELAKTSLFDPMNFVNAEWTKQDARGFDSASEGLRLRPIDMQKFGLLYLNEGCWEGHRLLSQTWVRQSFTPWQRSRPENLEPDYGWLWWQEHFSAGWIGHVASGSRGQRVAVFPEHGTVVTMTGAITDGSEAAVFAELMNRFVIPALTKGVDAETYESDMALDLGLNRAKLQNRIAPHLEPELTPSRARRRPRLPLQL